MIEDLIQTLVEAPTEENKENYFKFVNETEYSLLQEAETLPLKSQVYFDKRKKAFAYRRECAIILLNSWVSTHGSTDSCPVSYADTLNIPFQQIKAPK
jgi:hypothetical protein